MSGKTSDKPRLSANSKYYMFQTFRQSFDQSIKCKLMKLFFPVTCHNL